MTNDEIFDLRELGYSVDENTEMLVKDFLKLTEKIIAIVYFNNPNKWWKKTVRLLINISQGKDEFTSSNYFKEKAKIVLKKIKQDLQDDSNFDHDYTFLAFRKIIKIAELFLPPRQTPQFKINFVSMDELAANPNIKIEKNQDDYCLYVSQKAKIVIPHRPNFYFKGGVSRLLLKTFLGVDNATELPLNDFDAIISESELGSFSEFQNRYGLDPTGVEIYNNPTIEYPKDTLNLLDERDVTTNQSITSYQGIYFSDEAKKAILTGVTENLYSHHRIFGADGFKIPPAGNYPSMYVLRARGLARVLKIIAERKADLGLIKNIEKQIDLGMYWLVCLRKAMNKPNAVSIIERYFLQAEEMGHSLPNEKPLDFFNRHFLKYPFFVFGQNLNRIEAVHWMIFKFIHTIWDELRYKHKIIREHHLERSFDENNKVKIGVNLQEKERKERKNEIGKKLPIFQQEWRKISKSVNKEQNLLYERTKKIFY